MQDFNHQLISSIHPVADDPFHAIVSNTAEKNRRVLEAIVLGSLEVQVQPQNHQTAG